MPNRNKFRNTFGTDLIIVFGLAGAVYVFGASTDLAEDIWRTLRSFEGMELDEVLVAGFAFLVGCLVVAMRRISALEEQVAVLESLNYHAWKGHPPDESLVDRVVRCVGCGKYQIRSAQWFDPEAFSSYLERVNVLGGVCPNCRSASDDQGIDLRSR